MAISAERFTVDDDPIVALNDAVSNGQRLTVKNTDGAEPVYLGPSDVAAGTGYELDAGESITVVLEPNEVLYAVSTATGADVTVLRS